MIASIKTCSSQSKHGKSVVQHHKKLGNDHSAALQVNPSPILTHQQQVSGQPSASALPHYIDASLPSHPHLWMRFKKAEEKGKTISTENQWRTSALVTFVTNHLTKSNLNDQIQLIIQGNIAKVMAAEACTMACPPKWIRKQR